MQFNPVNDRVIVKPTKALDKTKGGLIIPEGSKNKSVEGFVIARGPGRRMPNGNLEDLKLEVGDFVLYSALNGTEIKIEDEDYLIIRYDDILTKVILEKTDLDKANAGPLVDNYKDIQSTKDL